MEGAEDPRPHGRSDRAWKRARIDVVVRAGRVSDRVDGWGVGRGLRITIIVVSVNCPVR